MDKRAPGRSHVSLSQAFRAQGIRLKFPTRSRSGIRWEDGAVVIAMDRRDVQSSAEGFRCRLWRPVHERRAPGADWPILKERYEHCRLAARHGSAEGLLIEKGGLVESDALLTLVVERRGAEYWASWGTTALRQRGLHQIPPEPATPIRAFAGPRG
jgi:hypothetical protein